MSWIGSTLKPVGGHFRTTLVAGVLFIIPLGITVLIFKFIFDFFDPKLDPFFEQFMDPVPPGLGIVALVILVYLAGLVAAHVLGRRLIRLGYSLVDRVPVISSVYRAARQATEVFSAIGSDGKYTSVVLVDFPGYGLRSIGLVTGRMTDQDGTPLLAVYMPTAPVPTSGFLVIMPEDRVTPTDMAVEDAIKLIVSAGVVSPDRIVSTPNLFTNIANPPPEFRPYSQGHSEQSPPSDSRASNQ